MMRGLAAQPFVSGFVGFALFGFSSLGIAIGVLFAIISAIITVCFAYPLLRRFLRDGRLTALRTVGYGAALGNIPAVIGAAFAIRHSRDLAAILTVTRAAEAGTIAGAVSAASFWIIAGRTLSAHDRSAT